MPIYRTPSAKVIALAFVFDVCNLMATRFYASYDVLGLLEFFRPIR